MVASNNWRKSHTVTKHKYYVTMSLCKYNVAMKICFDESRNCNVKKQPVRSKNQ